MIIVVRIMADGQITTSIDELLKYITEHGDTESTVLIAALGISQKTLEEWAEILEKANLLKITYRVGKMFIAPVSQSKEAIDMAKRSADMKELTLKEEIGTHVNALDAMEKKIETFTKFVSGSERIFKNKAGDIKTSLDRIDKLSEEANKNYKGLEEKKEFIDNLAAKLEKELTELNKKSEEINKLSATSENTAAINNDIRVKISAADAIINNLVAKYDETIRSQRKELIGIRDNVKKDIKSMMDSSKEMESQVDKYNKILQEYKNDAANAKINAEKESKKLLDDAAKMKGDVDRMVASADSEVKKLNSMLETIKKEFGGLADINDRLNEMKVALGEASKEKESIKKELLVLSKQLQALKSSSSRNRIKPEDREAKLDNMAANADEINTKLRKYGNKMSNMEDDVNNLSK